MVVVFEANVHRMADLEFRVVLAVVEDSVESLHMNMVLKVRTVI